MASIEKELNSSIINYIRDYKTDNQEGKEVCLQLLNELFGTPSSTSSSSGTSLIDIFKAGIQSLNINLPKESSASASIEDTIAQYECKYL